MQREFNECHNNLVDAKRVIADALGKYVKCIRPKLEQEGRWHLVIDAYAALYKFELAVDEFLYEN